MNPCSPETLAKILDKRDEHNFKPEVYLKQR